MTEPHAPTLPTEVLDEMLYGISVRVFRHTENGVSVERVSPNDLYVNPPPKKGQS